MLFFELNARCAQVVQHARSFGEHHVQFRDQNDQDYEQLVCRQFYQATTLKLRQRFMRNPSLRSHDLLSQALGLPRLRDGLAKFFDGFAPSVCTRNLTGTDSS